MRVILLVMDGFGIGSAPDAASYLNGDGTDEGANTLGNIARRCFVTGGDSHLPVLSQLGLIDSFKAVSPSQMLIGMKDPSTFRGIRGAMTPTSSGKDSPSGHWEICGQPYKEKLLFFPRAPNCIPIDWLSRISTLAKIPGFIGNYHASGTKIIRELGAQHLTSGKPIVYTSGDSVIQIAAHELHFGKDKLLELCRVTRAWLDNNNHLVGRVIARPFVGSSASDFTRTNNRRDFGMPAPKPTLLDEIANASGVVCAFGKISDLFANRGIHFNYPETDTRTVFGNLLASMKETQSSRHPVLLFANFGDFDNLYGHRRNPNGYGDALSDFDERLRDVIAEMNDRDVLMITADHGNDPTWEGTDHTREYVPVMAYGKKITPKNIGIRKSYADLGQSIASYLRIGPLPHGESFLD